MDTTLTNTHIALTLTYTLAHLHTHMLMAGAKKLEERVGGGGQPLRKEYDSSPENHT